MHAFDHDQPERMTPQKRSELCYGIREVTVYMVATIQLMSDNSDHNFDRKKQVVWGERVLRDAKAAAEGVSRLFRDAELEVEERRKLSEYSCKL